MKFEGTPHSLYGLEELFASVDQTVLPGDTMFDSKTDTLQHYFSVGASAMDIIFRAVGVARIERPAIGRILDYACGHGRVMRWLRAAFPDAALLGVDAHEPSVECARALGFEARHLDLALAEPLGEPFDLIWVGSLFTHLPQDETERGLRYLRRHLKPGGLLVFTMHGSHVIDWLETRSNTYGLTEEAVVAILRDVAADGYGYADYSHWPGYGISAARPLTMNRIITSCDLMPIMFQPHVWDAHQDAFACTIPD